MSPLSELLGRCSDNFWMPSSTPQCDGLIPHPLSNRFSKVHYHRSSFTTPRLTSFQDIETIDTSLAGTLNSVNNSLATLFSSILVVTYVQRRFGTALCSHITQHHLSILPGPCRHHWLYVSMPCHWMPIYGTWPLGDGIQFPLSCLLRIQRNAGRNRHCSDVLQLLDVELPPPLALQCFRWYGNSCSHSVLPVCYSWYSWCVYHFCHVVLYVSILGLPSLDRAWAGSELRGVNRRVSWPPPGTSFGHWIKQTTCRMAINL